MSLITIRSAVETDAGAIAAIYAHHVTYGTASFDTVARTPNETVALINHVRGRGWPFLVTEHAEVVTGYAYVTQFRDRAAYSFACENSIYVDPDYMGKGIGKALLERLLDASEEAGFLQMIAVIGGGEAASVALHAGFGFEHAGRMRSVGRKFGRWLDTVYMQRALGTGDEASPAFEPK